MTELQAIVMAAGRGSRMTELTSGCAKCMLPIGNMPLLWYPLAFLQKNGFSEAIVIVPETVRNKDIADSVSNKLEIKLDLVSIPFSEDWGTADSLRYIKDKLKNDFLIVSCDLITDFSLNVLADVHRINNATLTILLSAVSNNIQQIPPGHKRRQCIDRDIIGLAEKNNQLIILNSEADIEDHLEINTAMLKKHPLINLTTNLTDAHLYIMKREVLDYLCQHENISTMKGELLPALLKKQFTKDNTLHSKDPKKSSSKTDYTNLALELSSSKEKHMYSVPEAIRCYARVINEGFCYRVNTLSAYAEINRQLTKLQDSFPDISKPEINKIKFVGNDSIMGEKSETGEKVSIKKSVVGNLCKLANKVKVINSVIMDNAVIEEEASIQGCLICSSAKIGKKCELKDCIVGKDQVVADGLKLSNEVLADADEFMEI